MFQDLDATLAQLLLQELKPRFVIGDENISFVAPDEEFRKSMSSSPTLNLFLYDVRENWELRSNEWIDERSASGISRRRPPVRVDCAYLISAWSDEGGRQGLAAEHQLLGEVTRALLRYRILPRTLLQGVLKDVEPPARAKVIQQGYLQSLGEFWQAMGGRPRAALSYTVTLSVEISRPEQLGPPVTDKIIRMKQGSEEPTV